MESGRTLKTQSANSRFKCGRWHGHRSQIFEETGPMRRQCRYFLVAQSFAFADEWSRTRERDQPAHGPTVHVRGLRDVRKTRRYDALCEKPPDPDKLRGGRV